MPIEQIELLKRRLDRVRASQAAETSSTQELSTTDEGRRLLKTKLQERIKKQQDAKIKLGKDVLSGLYKGSLEDLKAAAKKLDLQADTVDEDAVDSLLKQESDLIKQIRALEAKTPEGRARKIQQDLYDEDVKYFMAEKGMTLDQAVQKAQAEPYQQGNTSFQNELFRTQPSGQGQAQAKAPATKTEDDLEKKAFDDIRGVITGLIGGFSAEEKEEFIRAELRHEAIRQLQLARYPLSEENIAMSTDQLYEQFQGGK